MNPDFSIHTRQLFVEDSRHLLQIFVRDFWIESCEMVCRFFKLDHLATGRRQFPEFSVDNPC